MTALVEREARKLLAAEYGEPNEHSRAYWQRPLDQLAKEDQRAIRALIAALRQPGAEYRQGVEAAAAWLEGEGPDRDNGGPCRHVEHAQGYCTCAELATAIRALSDSIPDTKGGRDGE